MKLVPINAPTLSEGPLGPSFGLYATPGTDLWRKPPSHDVQNAPCLLVNHPANSFRRARVTVSAEWTRLYDQGGLVLFLPGLPAHNLWLKTGIEFVDGKPHVSAVAARDAADWSLLPVPGDHSMITIEIEREEVNVEKGTGSSLWVYLVNGEARSAIREVTWVFKEEADMAGLISVGMYAARPTKLGENDDEHLKVFFEELTIE